MRDKIRECLRAIQTSMVETARPFFSESQLGHLGVLIRLTVEFDCYLKYGYPDLKDITEQHAHRINGNIQIDMNEQELTYSSESTFSGIDSFCSVNGAYSVLIGATKSNIEWGTISVPSLKELFLSGYRDFETEADFSKKCRLLLDLFKIQIVLAGVSYG
jgi:hypothetical protein